jgi:hypothetical protein
MTRGYRAVYGFWEFFWWGLGGNHTSIITCRVVAMLFTDGVVPAKRYVHA